MRIQPARRFGGHFTLPGDKSISHRLAILGALAFGQTRISNYSSAADCASTLRCLEALGVGVSVSGSEVRVSGRGAANLQPPRAPLDAGNSGSTLRMLAGVLAGRPFRSLLTGDASLRRRPVERVAGPLREMGAVAVSEGGRPPLQIDGGALRGARFDLPVASAQVKTALLLAGLQASGVTFVSEPAPSRDHTERLLGAFGVPVLHQAGAVGVAGGAALLPVAMTVPGDASSAAFLVVAGLIVPGARVSVTGVLLNPLRTGFIEVLRQMGGALEVTVDRSLPEPMGSITALGSTLGDATITPAMVPALIDEIPILAVAAAAGTGVLEVSGAAELRVKESDRIAALAEGLGRMGAAFETRPDGFRVRGGRLRGARVDAHGDHRIAMAFAVAALVAEGETEIDGAECVAVSFPDFFALLEAGRA